MMHTYRCYFLNGRSHFAAVEVVECGNDRAAFRRAKQILAARPAFSGIEVWEQGRRVPENSSWTTAFRLIRCYLRIWAGLLLARYAPLATPPWSKRSRTEPGCDERCGRIDAESMVK